MEFDLAAESLALVRVSSRPQDMGIIAGVNAQAAKLFGYNRRELVNRDVDAIIPAPIGEVHGMLLGRYMATGREVIIGSTRVLFGLHRAGHAFPCKAAIRASSSGAWMQHGWANISLPPQ